MPTPKTAVAAVDPHDTWQARLPAWAVLALDAFMPSPRWRGRYLYSMILDDGEVEVCCASSCGLPVPFTVRRDGAVF